METPSDPRWPRIFYGADPAINDKIGKWRLAWIRIKFLAQLRAVKEAQDAIHKPEDGKEIG